MQGRNGARAAKFTGNNGQDCLASDEYHERVSLNEVRGLQNRFSSKRATKGESDMRYKIWIALIVCGTFLVIVPPVSDYLMNYRVSQMLLERKDFNSVNLGVLPMSSQY